MHKYCYSNFGAIFAKGLFDLLVFNPSLTSPTNILAPKIENTMGSVNSEYYMASRRYKFYLQALIVSLTRSRCSLVRDTINTIR